MTFSGAGGASVFVSGAERKLPSILSWIQKLPGAEGEGSHDSLGIGLVVDGCEPSGHIKEWLPEVIVHVVLV